MCTFKYVAQKECAMRLTNSLWKFRKKKYCQSLQNHGSLTWLGLFPPIFPRCHTNLDPAANGGRRGVRLNRSKTGLKAAIQRNRRLRFLNTMTVLADASKTAIISIFYPLSDLPGLYQKSWMKVHKKKSYLADFFVKLLLKTSQALEGADVKPNTTGEGREDRQRALALLLALLSLICCHV